ncbi:DUF1669 domain-containing protein [Clostridium sp. WB02_MRS01]|uniref:phospholipase D-like domain-containing protein n=1 Tax=Clostridium sp. WB02_MRS01 TaxID=2605777 RepID=UPI0012B28D6F|nr:phospholipase D-like domain-containing protein [Clostridium sp. WB02_MRS01]MSS07068.1 DUF1669 domain-containing protein [Clostridium sp. WB02_MRS01]
MNDIFFCHPGEDNEIKKRVIEDIKVSQDKLLCAMAFFTDREIADEILKKEVVDKRIILNNADFQRDENAVAKRVFYNTNCIRLGTYYNESKFSSHMHNKVLVCDDIAWIGSYNFTYPASKNNWENMLRIDQKELVEKIIYEFESMWLYSQAIKDNLQGVKCKECGKVISDPMKHYAVFINTSFISDGIFDEEAITTLCLETHDKEDRLEKCAECGKLVPASQIVIIDDSSSFIGVCRQCAINDVKFLSTPDDLLEYYYEKVED